MRPDRSQMQVAIGSRSRMASAAASICASVVEPAPGGLRSLPSFGLGLVMPRNSATAETFYLARLTAPGPAKAQARIARLRAPNAAKLGRLRRCGSAPAPDPAPGAASRAASKGYMGIEGFNPPWRTALDAP